MYHLQLTLHRVIRTTQKMKGPGWARMSNVESARRTFAYYVHQILKGRKV